MVKPITYKALFAIAARNNWEVEQMDVKTAFLYRDLEDKVYIKIPTGFEQPNMVYKLNKALYSLKQAPRV